MKIKRINNERDPQVCRVTQISYLVFGWTKWKDNKNGTNLLTTCGQSNNKRWIDMKEIRTVRWCFLFLFVLFRDCKDVISKTIFNSLFHFVIFFRRFSLKRIKVPLISVDCSHAHLKVFSLGNNFMKLFSENI